MRKRINITLPDETLAVLERIAPKGGRSRFVSDAVIYFVKNVGQKSFKARIKAGYLANADENLRMAAEWFPLEEEAWPSSTSRVKRGK
jgi:metal-responsive CopG/Arc/MetJ family transcriptional regulator